MVKQKKYFFYFFVNGQKNKKKTNDFYIQTPDKNKFHLFVYFTEKQPSPKNYITID